MLPTTSATVFQVADIEVAVAFYCDVLGFTEDFRYDNYAGVYLGPAKVTSLALPTTYLYLCAHTIWNRPIGGGAVVIIGEEVDDYCATIKQRGAPILLEPTDEPYGLRDFVTRDPDGNVLTFSAPLPTLHSGA
jgi:catechol 2,3-dioxygenase-like lactoylglutathione lyase family enzyme